MSGIGGVSVENHHRKRILDSDDEEDEEERVVLNKQIAGDIDTSMFFKDDDDDDEDQQIIHNKKNKEKSLPAKDNAVSSAAATTTTTTTITAFRSSSSSPSSPTTSPSLISSPQLSFSKKRSRDGQQEEEGQVDDDHHQEENEKKKRRVLHKEKTHSSSNSLSPPVPPNPSSSSYEHMDENTSNHDRRNDTMDTMDPLSSSSFSYEPSSSFTNGQTSSLLSSNHTMMYDHDDENTRSSFPQQQQQQVVPSATTKAVKQNTSSSSTTTTKKKDKKERLPRHFNSANIISAEGDGEQEHQQEGKRSSSSLFNEFEDDIMIPNNNNNNNNNNNTEKMTQKQANKGRKEREKKPGNNHSATTMEPGAVRVLPPVFIDKTLNREIHNTEASFRLVMKKVSFGSMCQLAQHMVAEETKIAFYVDVVDEDPCFKLGFRSKDTTGGTYMNAPFKIRQFYEVYAPNSIQFALPQDIMRNLNASFNQLVPNDGAVVLFLENAYVKEDGMTISSTLYALACEPDPENDRYLTPIQTTAYTLMGYVLDPSNVFTAIDLDPLMLAFDVALPNLRAALAIVCSNNKKYDDASSTYIVFELSKSGLRYSVINSLDLTTNNVTIYKPTTKTHDRLDLLQAGVKHVRQLTAGRLSKYLDIITGNATTVRLYISPNAGSIIVALMSGMGETMHGGFTTSSSLVEL